MAEIDDIFNPQISHVAAGLDGKVIFIYGPNNTGKTFQAVRMKKPLVLACESGLNAINGVPYKRVNSWSDFKRYVMQLTSKAYVKRARELYNTIIIDEVYASSIFCQDYICQTFGDGALALGDNKDPRKNLYQLYEKEYFRTINALLSADYTVVFIGHETEKDEYITPKGDKRCLNPIIDNSDFVIHLSANGVDEDGNVIYSTANLAATNEFFARSRFTNCVTEIAPFTAENLEKAIEDAVNAEVEASGIEAITYQEQKEQNTSKAMSYDEVMEALNVLGDKFEEAGDEGAEAWTDIVEEVLGQGGRVSNCTKKQISALLIIYDNLCMRAEELGI